MTSFLDILKNVCILAHEKPPATVSQSNSPFPEIKQYIRNIVEEVCSKYPWTFRERKYVFNTAADQREYSLVSGLIPANIIEDGVRIQDSLLPIDYVHHNVLDTYIVTSGKPSRYSVFAGKLILDPIPDGVYEVQIKYLTVNYAVNSSGTLEKSNLEEDTDRSIIPERFIKIIEWGAYSLFRQNYKPDEKYKTARDKYLQYLIDMQKDDGHSSDSKPSVKIEKEIPANQRLVRDFFKNVG